MRTRRPRLRMLAGSALCLASLSSAAAEVAEPDGAFSYSADVLDSSLRTDTAELVGNVRVIQGARSIEADQATASAFRSENSRWLFEDSVRVRTEEAALASDSASAAFANGELIQARIEGTPARFEQLDNSTDREVKGRARVIEYDVNDGIVKLTGDVWFSYGQDEFRGDTVIYSIRDERVRVNPDGEAGRVKGIIRPGANGQIGAKPPTDEPDAIPSTEESAAEKLATESDA